MPALATLALVLGSALAPAGPPVPAAVADALRRAVPVAGGRLEIAEYRPTLPQGCLVARAEVPAPVAGSGRVAVRLEGSLPSGALCDGWAFARVRLLAPVLVASRSLRTGDPIAGAVAPEERELLPGRLSPSMLPADAVAARNVSLGQALDERDLRLGPTPGEAVTVVIQFGSLRVEQPGRSVPCARGRACALTPAGKRVEGTWRDGRLYVDSP